MGPTTGDAIAKAEQLSEYLTGTTNTMPDWVHDDPQEDVILAELDQLTFECAACGWWCEMSEANENPEVGDGDICNDCMGG